MGFFRFTRKELIGSVAVIFIIGAPYLYQTYKMYAYGKSFNDERVKLHLPVIGEDYQRSDNWEYWMNPSDSYPQHTRKEIQVHKTLFDNYSIKIESDHFAYMEGDSLVQLDAYYHFEEDCCSYHYYGMGKHQELDLKEFNQLLRQNGFSFQYDRANCK